jgi:hypothetical protein
MIGPAVALAVLAMAGGLTGCAPQGSAQDTTQTPEYRSIPTTSERPADPTATPRSDGSVTADQAPLSQLWAVVDSGLAHGGYADSTRAAAVIPQDVADFANAITTRCVPGLTDAEAGQLAPLWNDLQSSASAAGADITPAVRSYFTEATSLCM